MSRSHNSKNSQSNDSQSNDNQSSAFELGRHRQARVVNSRNKRQSARPVIVCVLLLLLLFVGIYMHHRKNASLDQLAHAPLADKHLTTGSVAPVEANTPSPATSEPSPSTVDNTIKPSADSDQIPLIPAPAKAEDAPSDGGPTPDGTGSSEASVISDATSSPATQPTLGQSKKTDTPSAETSETKPVAPVADIPMSAFPSAERIWTKASGKYLLGSALAYDDQQGTVVLRSSDGKVLSVVAIEELCPADLEFLSELTKLASNRAAE